jgi:hypothetical protein
MFPNKGNSVANELHFDLSIFIDKDQMFDMFLHIVKHFRCTLALFELYTNPKESSNDYGQFITFFYVGNKR